MLNLDDSIFNAVITQACIDAAAHGRWLVAIGRAVVELTSNPYIERNAHGGLIIGSPSGNVYSSNGVCGCKAYEFKQACWHRAAARIVRRHDEAQAIAFLNMSTVEEIEALVERQIAPLSERLAKARAEMAELFA